MTKILGVTALAIALAMAGSVAMPVTAEAAPARGTVKGHIRTESGAPVKGILVKISGGQKTVRTDSRGYYSIPVMPGTRNVRVEDTTDVYADEYAPVAPANTVTVSAGKSTVFNETLHKGGVITGRVLSATGGPAADVQVRAYGSNDFINAAVTTDSTGKFVITGLRPDSYTVDYALLDQVDFLTATYPTPVVVDYGEKRTGTGATLTPAARITGKLYLDGKQLADDREGTTATLIDATGTELRTISAQDGFKFYGLPAGDYTIRFGSADSAGVFNTVYYGDAPDASTAAVIHVDAGQRASGLTTSLTRNTAIGRRLASDVDVSLSATKLTRGKTLGVTVAVDSYGDPTGARVDLIWGEKVRATGTVAADGTVKLTASTATLSPGKRKIKIYYQGTTSTERHPVYSYVTIK